MGKSRFTRGEGLFGSVRATTAYIGATAITPTTVAAVPILEDIRTVSVSFATAGLGTIKIYYPFKVTINKIRTVVTSTIGITNDATVTCGNSTGASANGVVTIDAGALTGVEDSATPTTNNVVLADGYYYLTIGKGATVGGTAIVTLESTKTV